VYRFVPPRNYNPTVPLPTTPRGGYLDRFGNEWQEGPAHGLAAAEGDINEWDVQLSQAGINIWGSKAKKVRGVYYINATRNGFLSH
jgi:Novel toxin 17